MDHEHLFAEVKRHESDDRIRTKEACLHCFAYRFSCEAKKLDIDGGESWGPVGKKLYTEPRYPENANGQANV